MKVAGNGFIIGYALEWMESNFTGRDGSDVHKIEVLIGAGEGGKVACEAFGTTATKFTDEVREGELVIIRVGIVGREWKSKDGGTGRAVSLRIRDWEKIDATGGETQVDSVTTTKEEVPF